jgi:protein-S-isoprenylcysteine O-methyltransferase Ste14
MFVRALVAFLVLPVVVAGLVPLLIAGGDVGFSRTAVLGVPVLLIGFLLLIWCVRDFYVSGKGTLAPWDPPKHLVVVGLYRFVRNPMYIAVLTIIAGWALIFGSLRLGLYLLFLAVVFHLRVLYYEEPWLKRKFNADWEKYSKEVPRWLPHPRS